MLVLLKVLFETVTSPSGRLMKRGHAEVFFFFWKCTHLQVCGECLWCCSRNVVVLAAVGGATGAAQVWKDG